MPHIPSSHSHPYLKIQDRVKLNILIASSDLNPSKFHDMCMRAICKYVCSYEKRNQDDGWHSVHFWEPCETAIEIKSQCMTCMMETCLLWEVTDENRHIFEHIQQTREPLGKPLLDLDLASDFTRKLCWICQGYIVPIFYKRELFLKGLEEVLEAREQGKIWVVSCLTSQIVQC